MLLRCLKIVIMLMLVAGCASVRTDLLPPTPDTTPFDSNPAARATYIDAYHAGFRAAARNQYVSYRYFPDDRYRPEWETGWQAGIAAARAAHAKEQSKPAEPESK